mgnify:CR=1 FL=1
MLTWCCKWLVLMRLYMDNRKADEILTDMDNDIIEFFNFIDDMFTDNKKENE